MLDSKSKQILSLLKPYALNNPNVRISSEFIAENLQLSINEITSALNYLENIGYLTLVKAIGCKPVVFNVKHQGIYFDELEKTSFNNQTFNINSVNNSAFGNNGTTIFNNGNTLDEIRSLITNKPKEDQEQLNKLIDSLEIIIENSETVSKGFLSKFSDVLKKHSDIIVAIGPPIINWLTSI